MVVVADTTPINYLLLIGEIRLLPELYGTVIVPRAVGSELRDPSAPDIVRRWMALPPAWMEERDSTGPPRSEIPELDHGETEAIELALELSADLVLIDDARGREAAFGLKLRIRGTVGILIQAAVAGLVDLKAALDRLETTNFHITAALRERAIQAASTQGIP